MADFETAFKITMQFEGGYSKDPADPGGETYRGIARKRHPSWAGWRTIDQLKSRTSGNLNRTLNNNARLQSMVKQFYKDRFWNQMLGDQIPDQGVAEEVFDTSVNMGLRRSIRFLQESINLLNRNRQLEDITVDGWLGKKTLTALRKLLRQDQSNDYMMALLNLFQGKRYIELMRQRPTLEKFARGWLRRTQQHA